MIKSLDRKLAAIHANPDCNEFILADAKDADMALGLGAPGLSPELHAGEVRFKTLEEYREQMRLITKQALVDIMLMSASSSHALTLQERIFENSPVTPAIRANDTTDIHLARGSSYAKDYALPFRTASLDHAQCGHLDCAPEERTLGANLGLYSVTFNNDLAHDIETLRRFHAFREEAERKGFRYFLEVFDPNMPGRIAPDVLPHYLNDMITRMLAGVGPAGRPVFLKIVYHGPKAMEELVRWDRNLIVGILGGSSGTTRDAFQLLHDAQKYGAKVALFGRKINHSENQLAFVQFLRLIVEGVIGPVDAVKAYHAVLGKLGVRPHRPLDVDLSLTDQSMSYSGSSTVAVPAAVAVSSSNGEGKPASDEPCRCQIQAKPAASNGATGECGCHATTPSPVILTPSKNGVTEPSSKTIGYPILNGGRPDFGKMTSDQRLSYHLERLGLRR